MNINNFVWQFNGKNEGPDDQTPLISMYALPFKKEWLLNRNGNSNANFEELINKYFNLNIAETTSLQIFFRNNDNVLPDFSVDNDNKSREDSQLCHYFHGDSIYAILSNHRIIRGRRIFCDDFLLAKSNIGTYSQIAEIRYLLEGGYVLPSHTQRFLLFFENTFNFEDITLIYWKYIDNYYQLEKHKIPAIFDQIATKEPHL